MRPCRSQWLLSVSLIAVQFLAPMILHGLLVGAKDMEPPALTPTLIKQVDAMVESTWLECGLDKKSLDDVRKHFNYNHVLDILRTISGTDTKDTSPGNEGVDKALSPEIKQTLLSCLSKQPLIVSLQESAKNLPIDYIKALLASLRRDIAQGPSDTMATPGTPPKSDKGSDSSSETTPKEKTVPQTKKSTANKEDSSGMPTTAIIGLSVSGIALLVLLFLCCFMCHANRTSSHDSKDDKPLLSLNLSGLSAASHKSAQGNPIDINKLGTLSLKSEAEHNGKVKLNSSEGPNTEVEQAVYNSLTEPMPASTYHIPGSMQKPPPKLPPPAPPPPKAPTPQAPPAPPSRPALYIPPETSPPPAPKSTPPPLPPKSAGPPHPPPPAMPSSSKLRPPPLAKKTGNKVDDNAQPREAKTKLKPFFWDKVAANPDQSMVWDHIKAGSFQFNEEMMENLFGYNSVDKKGDAKKDISSKDACQFVRILDPKKAQNLAISLRALCVPPEEVCSAVKEGNELPQDLIQTLLRWTPSNDEELRLRLYTGEISQLGPAEQFLKSIIDIPHIYQRLDALLFMSNLPEEASNVKQSFATLEVACQELRNSRLFLKLLEAVLKTGNRMNVGTFRGGAQAFKLDTLLKLSDVKGTDGTTLLHFVVTEIIRSEGARAARTAKEQNTNSSSVNANDEKTEDDYKQLALNVVSKLGDELQNVRKAAILDADQLTMSVASLGHKLVKTKEFLNTSMKSLDEDSGFHHKLKNFTEQSETDVTFLLEEEKKIRSLVKSTVDYFHGSAGKDEGLRLFVIVRDFLAMLDKVCKEVKEASKGAPRKTQAKQPSQTSESSDDTRRNIFPAIQVRRTDSSSSSSDEDD